MVWLPYITVLFVRKKCDFWGWSQKYSENGGVHHTTIHIVGTRYFWQLIAQEWWIYFYPYKLKPYAFWLWMNAYFPHCLLQHPSVRLTGKSSWTTPFLAYQLHPSFDFCLVRGSILFCTFRRNDTFVLREIKTNVLTALISTSASEAFIVSST